MTDVADVDAFAERVGGPVVVKTVRGGYDGRGVLLARDLAEARDVASRYLADGVPVLVEERVAMRRELAALVARSPFGQGAAWPVVETVQRDGICVEVIAPAPGLARRDRQLRAGQLALRLAAELGVVGVLAVELFETVDGATAGQRAGDAPAQLRPLDHGRRRAPASSNSICARCWTIRSATPRPIAPVTVMANVLGAPETPAMAMDERLHHLFAPDARRQGAPVRQGGAARPQDRARQHRRRRDGRRRAYVRPA